MTDDRSPRLLDWPGEQRFYLTVDFECDYGTALSENHYGAVERVGELVAMLERHDVPLTAFVQTELLDERPTTVERLRDAGVDVEFHPHSHTHAPRSETTVAEEITRSTDRYREFFGRSPQGYRFPNGNVRPADYEVLADAGYEFDASLFPSWRPGHFDHSDEPTVPHRVPDADLYEVPFTVFGDRFRVPTALSYCRLVGRPMLALLARRPPSSVVFNIHMHDLFNPESYAELPPLYRAIYARNADGFGMLDTVLETFSGMDYEFEQFGTLVDELGT